MPLIAIQREVKAAKSKFNKFGGFRYRSCEDICEAVKPVLEKYGATLTLTDDLILLGEWVFVKSSAVLVLEDRQFVAVGFARIDHDKKGMDSAQLTGSASSYARKYALNGLFLIDDAQDPDAQEPPPVSAQMPRPGNPPLPPPLGWGNGQPFLAVADAVPPQKRNAGTPLQQRKG